RWCPPAAGAKRCGRAVPSTPPGGLPAGARLRRAPRPLLRQRAAPAWARGVGGTCVRPLYPDDRPRGRPAPWAAGRIRGRSFTHAARWCVARPGVRFTCRVEEGDVPDDPIMRWEWEGGAPGAIVTSRPEGEVPAGRAERRGHGGVFARPRGPQPERVDSGRRSRTRRRADPPNGV